VKITFPCIIIMWRVYELPVVNFIKYGKLKCVPQLTHLCERY